MSGDLTPSALWYEAYANPPGIKVRVADPVQAKALLYTARKNLRDPDILHLEIRTSPVDPKGEIWIVNPGDPTLTPPEKVMDLGEI